MSIHKLKAVTIVLLAASAIASGFPAPAPARPIKDVTHLEQKLLGSWTGQGGCTGIIIFREDGTYRREHYGPVNATVTGKWQVRWDALPPTLLLTQKTFDEEQEEIEKVWELKITQLDDANFHYKSRSDEPETRYKREEKK